MATREAPKRNLIYKMMMMMMMIVGMKRSTR